MVSEQSSRKVAKLLREAGWVPAADFVGSHRKWVSPQGRMMSIPEGHRMISPGVVRKIVKAIEENADDDI
ncbi:type II toxin-antitoxin system HicA family toxin [Subtercola lobariae]|uniref:type II toxin-antitoxin system HicA family toxin n=1 Tax=Subtercola lobariae TaxID=1588641 RepID=UPI00166950C7|nr:type II toxin-antitoxin system HicA family toxin [Subtercola lobariae]